jgi:hypothetical protein
MRCQNLNCFVSVGAAAALAFLVAAYDHNRALGQPGDDVNRDTRPADTRAPQLSPKGGELQSAAFHAYIKSIEGFKSGEIIDPEIVYRWSMRLMKVEQKLKTRTPPAEGHLRRMRELAQIVRESTRKEGPDQELKIWAAGYYEEEAAEFVKAAEQAQLAKGAATPDDVVPPSPDAAVQAAEMYLGAVLEGNYHEAAGFAVPGSLATSSRLMDSIKGLISGKSISVLAIQNSGRRTAVLMQEAQSAEDTADSRPRTQFTVVLEPKDGRWLVTNFSANKTHTPSAPSRPSAVGQPRPEDASDTAPKRTRVIILKHAKASELQQTISQLLELDSADLRIAVDARTNRLLIHGTADRFKEVLQLIEELDVPSAVKEALPMIEIPKDPDVPGTAAATDPRPVQDSLPSPRSPADTKP